MTALIRGTQCRRRAWLVVAAAVVVCSVATAATPTSVAAVSDSLTSCDGDAPYYTALQQTNTRAFLQEFQSSIYPLSELWECSNFCSWEYVTCTEAGVELDLSWSDTFGDLPALPSAVDGGQVVLTKIDVAGVDLGGNLPPSWAALTLLQHVSVASTNVAGVLPSSWSMMTSLKHVDASSSLVLGTLPSSWSALPALTVFRAGSSFLSGTIPASWGVMRGLQEFNLHGSRLTGTLPESWSTLTTLLTLRLDGSALTGSIPESFSEMRSIAIADLQGNQFCGCLPSQWLQRKSDGSLTVTASAALLAGDCAIANSCPVASSSFSAASSSSAASSATWPSSSSSSSSGACNAAVPSLTVAQADATRVLLATLRGAFSSLTDEWQCANFCTWRGIGCTTSNVHVSLVNFGLTGVMPSVPAIENSGDLAVQTIDLSGNPGITGTLAMGWLTLPHLTWFNVSGCGISGGLPEFVRRGGEHRTS